MVQRSDLRGKHPVVVARPRKTVPTADLAEAAAVLRRLLSAVKAGELDAETPQARRLLRRLEGAVGAWEVEGRRAPSDSIDENSRAR